MNNIIIKPVLKLTIELTQPITLESLSREAPVAFKELAAMDSDLRSVMLLLLNGATTAPAGYGIADHERVKEDAIISDLRTKCFVEITTERVRGNQCLHRMSAGQIAEFFIDRDAMRKRVCSAVNARKIKRQRKDVLNAKKNMGLEWVQAILQGEGPGVAANDD